jgi:Fe-S oxidoreductase
LYRCNKCGFCQATCPHYRDSREEWAVARGRLRLIKGVREKQLAPSEGYARRLFECFMCGGCATACPSSVEIEALFLEARRELAQDGLLPAPLAQLGETITATGGLTGETGDARMSWAQNLDFAPPVGGAHELIYFVGCVSSLYPAGYRPPQRMASLLRRAGTDYAVLGGEEACCGYPLYISGLVDRARELARANVARVAATGAQRLLTTCPSCYRAWREFYPELLGETPGVEVVHAVEWLAEADLELGQLPGGGRATYHDPCDLGRGTGIYDPPRQFLSRIEGLEMVEMAQTRAEALCCGGGGNMESLEQATSQSVAQARVAQAAATGAELLITACPQCERTLTAARSRETRMRVMDIVEVAWRALGEP